MQCQSLERSSENKQHIKIAQPQYYTTTTGNHDISVKIVLTYIGITV